MYRLGALGATLLTSLAMSAAAAVPSAMAEPEWLIDGNPVAEEIEDTAKTSGNVVTIEYKGLSTIVEECAVDMPGRVAPNGAGTINATAKFEECKGAAQEVAWVNTGYVTQLTLVMEGVNDLYRDLVLPKAANEPVAILFKAGGIDNICNWETGSELFAEATNNAEGWVDWVFHGNEAPAAKCPGGASLKIDGLLVYAKAGHSLSVSG